MSKGVSVVQALNHSHCLGGGHSSMFCLHLKPVWPQSCVQQSWKPEMPLCCVQQVCLEPQPFFSWPSGSPVTWWCRIRLIFWALHANVSFVFIPSGFPFDCKQDVSAVSDLSRVCEPPPPHFTVGSCSSSLYKEATPSRQESPQVCPVESSPLCLTAFIPSSLVWAVETWVFWLVDISEVGNKSTKSVLLNKSILLNLIKKIDLELFHYCTLVF